MQKIILFYKFTLISDPESVRLWQLALCQQHNLQGRIIISTQGINATLGGNTIDLKTYIKQLKSYKPFKDTDIKWSEGSREDFPRLSIKVRDEIVTFNAKENIQLSKNGIKGSGKHISGAKLHELVKLKGKDLVFFDGRNNYEASIGRFKNAVVTGAQHTRDFKNEITKNKYHKYKHKTVITYCTGGIRCEVLSTLMKQNGFKDVYQLKGGIVKYGQEYKDGGLWQGKLYVFDKRLTTQFSDKAKDIGDCSACKSKTSNFINCANKSCNSLILKCLNCAKQTTYCNQCAPNSSKVTA